MLWLFGYVTSKQNDNKKLSEIENTIATTRTSITVSCIVIWSQWSCAYLYIFCLIPRLRRKMYGSSHARALNYQRKHHIMEPKQRESTRNAVDARHTAMFIESYDRFSAVIPH